jgi:hypothetical protein
MTNNPGSLLSTETWGKYNFWNAIADSFVRNTRWRTNGQSSFHPVEMKAVRKVHGGR